MSKSGTCSIVLTRGKYIGNICGYVHHKCRHVNQTCPNCEKTFIEETSWLRHRRRCRPKIKVSVGRKHPKPDINGLVDSIQELQNDIRDMKIAQMHQSNILTNSKRVYQVSCSENQNAWRMGKTHYIYLLHEREFIKTGEPIYKIGRTQQEHLRRASQYSKGSVLCLHMKCQDGYMLENKVKRFFCQKYVQRLDIGQEYFEGNLAEMIKYITDIVLAESSQVTDDNVSSHAKRLEVTDSSDAKCIEVTESSDVKCLEGTESSDVKCIEVTDNSDVKCIEGGGSSDDETDSSMSGCQIILKRGKYAGEKCCNTNNKCRHTEATCSICDKHFIEESTYLKHKAKCRKIKVSVTPKNKTDVDLLLHTVIKQNAQILERMDMAKFARYEIGQEQLNGPVVGRKESD